MVKIDELPRPADEIRTCRQLVEDLRAPAPGVYMADIAASALLGWGGAVLVVVAPLPGVLRALLFVLSVLALYRGLAFIHELFHQTAMTGVRLFWHAVIGVPLLLPLLLYLPIHQAHHNAGIYGTADDGEYEQLKGRFGAMLLKLVALNLVLPLALWLRFAVLTPLSWVVPTVRDKVLPSFVHLSMRVPFTAPALSGAARAEAQRYELACCLFAWALVAGGFSGGAQWVLTWAALLVAIATLNTLRAACSTHLYDEQAKGRNALGQLQDSMNIDSTDLLTQALCPVGLQYHGLHHVAPYLPYHALPEAHRRLVAALPAHSAYRQATVASLWHGVARLVEVTRLQPR